MQTFGGFRGFCRCVRLYVQVDLGIVATYLVRGRRSLTSSWFPSCMGISKDRPRDEARIRHTRGLMLVFPAKEHCP